MFVYYCIHLDVCKWGQSKLATLDLTLFFHVPFNMILYVCVCMLAVGVHGCCTAVTLKKVQGMSLLTTVQEQHKGIPPSFMPSQSSGKF